MGHLVFVYGTLKRGERNFGRMAGARFVGTAATRDAAFTLREYDSVSHPGRITPDVSAGGVHRIAGELFEVDDQVLAALDRFERVGTDYERQAVALADGQVAQMYLRAANSLRPAKPVTALARTDGEVVSWSEFLTSARNSA
ncbi:MAG: gamma-glutamylcyclotransferase family protein [Devosia sp.]